MAETPQPKLPPPPRDPVRAAFDRIEAMIAGRTLDEDLVEKIVARPLDPATQREALYLLSTIPAALAALLVWSISGSLAVVLAVSIVGIPLLALALWPFRWFAGIERSRLRIVDAQPLEVHYMTPEGNLLQRGIGHLSDPQLWKDIGWLLTLSLGGIPIAVIALSAWLIAAGWLVYPLWGWALPGDQTPIGFIVGQDMSVGEAFLMIPFGMLMIVVAAWLCAAATLLLTSLQRLLLSSGREQLLRERVAEVERTREHSLAQQSSELSRLERDLHDGAQARLVALAMDLGMAEQKFEDDPDAARELVSQARDEAQRTLQELRDLVRGIGPQILRDRGLRAALVPLVARSPIDVDLNIELPTRLDERVESTAYFFASEALANAIKHSAAERIVISARTHDRSLHLRITDNGQGGADPAGSGLAGLRARVEAVDGEMLVESPSGGPTIIDAWLPLRQND